jgi:hypothetical protein
LDPVARPLLFLRRHYCAEYLDPNETAWLSHQNHIFAASSRKGEMPIAIQIELDD